jgi:(p)ppGpp synthase/HD superfamily hydrolase
MLVSAFLKGAAMDTVHPIEKALALALTAHQGQKRKGGGTPYILHPIEVGLLLSQAGASDESVCAGFLHDILEDTGMDIAKVRDLLGERVADLVGFMTEPEHNTLPWEQRKQHTIELVSRTEDPEKLLLLLSDKLSNLRSIRRDQNRLGSKIWDRFNAGKDRQAWYYKSIAKAIQPRLGEHPLYGEYDQILRDLFA